MEKRFEESFNEIGLIYEAYLMSNKTHGQTDTVDSKSSLRKGQFTAPGGLPSQYRANQAVGGYVVSDEEAPEETPENPIILKIEEMQKEAEEHGQDYALLQLAELKKFIEEA